MLVFKNQVLLCAFVLPRLPDVGSGGHAVERWTVSREDVGSIPPNVISKLRQFRSPHISLCLSEETLKAGGPFYLVK